MSSPEDSQMTLGSSPEPEIESQTTVEDEEDSIDWNDDDDDEEESYESEDDRFPYTVSELAAIFTEFYQFLATLHFDPALLKFPPPEGWAELAPEITGSWKDDFALEVLRHLPYFHEGGGAPVEYKSRLMDYTTVGADFFLEPDRWEDCMTYEHDGTTPFQRRMAFIFAEGHESFGQQYILDAEHGEVHVEQLRADGQGPFDVREFLAEKMAQYRELKVISSPGRASIDAARVPERAERISEEEVLAQAEGDTTDLDVQFLRQVYRDHGWPEVFRRVECRAYIDEFMGSMERARSESSVWEEDWIGSEDHDGREGAY